ncbi:MAG: YbhB/YbcL family Raf kinase inhibitor-like protein [Candidatus Hydrogenedentota bacterium]|nr:MAG: YbhB/YbcL family Raf kinase inhibitor-like protein [Candidatus Hydrogenedentota bacterium]
MNRMYLKSTAFAHEQEIPSKYTCEGDDISPPLEWGNAPNGTKGFALIMDDPDAPDPANPKMVWDHWVLYNIPASVNHLPEKILPRPKLTDGSTHGKNSWNNFGYGGPCPPIGRHRYFFKLYALDNAFSFEPGLSKKQLLEKIKNHVLEEAILMGTYQKKR